MNKELLKKIISAPSPVGKEDAVIKTIVDDTREYVDEHIYDNYGSLTSVYNKDSDFKISLMAHSDEISLVVNGYNHDGSLSVTSNGGIRSKLYIGNKVRIICEDKVLKGIMGVNSGLLSKEKVSADDLFVDLGCKTKEEVMKLVPLGSFVIHDVDYEELQNDIITARAFDDRLGVFITQEACKKAKEMGATSGIYCTATVGEENTGRGAYASGALIKPDAAVIVDVTYATDYKGADEAGEVKIGEGGVICLGSIINRKLVKLLEQCAKELNQKVQYEVWPGRTGTDGDTLLKTNNGVPIVLFSIPLRYMHSPVEVASIKDIESMIDVLALFLVKLTKEYSLVPYKF